MHHDRWSVVQKRDQQSVTLRLRRGDISERCANGRQDVGRSSIASKVACTRRARTHSRPTHWLASQRLNPIFAVVCGSILAPAI